MSRLLCLVSVTLMLGLSACGTVPESREHFVELMKEGTGVGPFKRLAFTKVVAQPFDAAFANIEDKLAGCVPGGYQSVSMRGSSMSSLSVSNNQRIERVSAGRAEITIQQYHSATVRQSEGGFYLLAADMRLEGSDSLAIDFYVGQHYLALADAVEQWAKGSDQCHGIGGNP